VRFVRKVARKKKDCNKLADHGLFLHHCDILQIQQSLGFKHFSFVTCLAVVFVKPQ
jgi:hypothetical protein